jgi:hypothetical protein
MIPLELSMLKCTYPNLKTPHHENGKHYFQKAGDCYRVMRSRVVAHRAITPGWD